MNRRQVISLLMMLGLSDRLFSKPRVTMKQNSITLLRHATILLQFNNKTILVDPMLSAKSAQHPIPNCGNDIRIPMVELPLTTPELDDMLLKADAVVVTHLHRDHWDEEAQKRIDKNKTIFCQPGDETTIKEQGFTNVIPISDSLEWSGIKIHRTSGQHGTGEIGEAMGKVSGFVFKTTENTIYVAGDTIWCEDVNNALEQFKPDVTVLNTGGAKFLSGEPITMTPDDVMKVYTKSPNTKIVAVHMDTVNHCFVTRQHLRKALQDLGVDQKILIPQDGESITL